MTLKESPSVQLTTNNNRLRAYNYRVTEVENKEDFLLTSLQYYEGNDLIC